MAIIPRMLKRIFSYLLPLLVFLALFELLFRGLGVPRGGGKFVETVVWRNHLSAHPSPGEFRIFTYGESTFVGAQHAPLSSPVRWMEAYLEDFLPQKNIRVVNFARMGHGSAFTLQTFRETLDYHPQIAIFYLGHNDFLPGERVDQNDATLEARKMFWLELLYGSRFIAYFYRTVLRIQVAKREARDHDRMGTDEIETAPHELNMGGVVSPQSPLYLQNLKFVENNIDELLRLAAHHHVKVLFLRPVSNLKDFEPLISGHLKELSPDALKSWQNHFDHAEKLFNEKDFVGARTEYAMAYQADPTYALLPFRLGRIAFDQGELDLARRYFTEARDHDLMPCRANKDMLELLEKTTSRYGIPLMDTEKFILPEVPGGIPGEPVIEDNVHFSIPGESRVGRAMSETLADLGWILPRSEWQFARTRSYEKIYQDLGISRDLEVKALIQVCSYLGTRFRDRIRTAERALKMDPESVPALRNLAWAYWIADQKDKASEIYAKLHEKDPAILRSIFNAHPELKGLLADFRDAAA